MLFLQLPIIALLSYLFILIIIKNAHKLKLLDTPNERSHHCNIIPSGAGIGFISAFFVSIFLFEFQLLEKFWFLFAALAIVFFTGIYDDRNDISAKFKFITIFIAVLLICINGYAINTFGVWYGHDLSFVWWLAFPLSMFFIAGFTNALNLIDGIDGLSSSVSVVILLFFVFIGIEYNDHTIFTIAAFTIAALVGFMVLNWNPAKVFMGDSGSLSLGFTISILALLSLKHIHPVAVLYLAALPILDTLIVMVRRIRRGKSPFKPDKTHLHHILVKFFDMNVPKTVYFLVVLQIIFSGIGYMILDTINKGDSKNIPLFALLGFVMMFVLFYMIFTGIKKRQKMIDKKIKKISKKIK